MPVSGFLDTEEGVDYSQKDPQFLRIGSGIAIVAGILMGVKMVSKGDLLNSVGWFGVAGLGVIGMTMSKVTKFFAD